MKRLTTLVSACAVLLSPSGAFAAARGRVAPQRVGLSPVIISPAALAAPSMNTGNLAVPSLSQSLAFPSSIALPQSSLPVSEAAAAAIAPAARALLPAVSERSEKSVSRPAAVGVRARAGSEQFKTVREGVQDARKDLRVIEKNTGASPQTKNNGGESAVAAGRTLFDGGVVYNAADNFRLNSQGVNMAVGRSAARAKANTVRLPKNKQLAPPPEPELLVREMVEPPKLLRAKGIKAIVTVYGSARIVPRREARRRYEQAKRKFGSSRNKNAREEMRKAEETLKMSRYYEEARKFGALVAERGGGDIGVVTGGGPGIMEAANRGAFEAGGPSIGYNIILDHEQSANSYISPGLEFEFQTFSTRKMSLRHDASALVYFPGGFGTMDEFFEVITLIQTAKFQKRPMVLVGRADYWDRILNFEAFREMGVISPEDLDLIRFADTAEEAWAIVEADMKGA